MRFEVTPGVAALLPGAHFATLTAHGLDTPVDRPAFDALLAGELARLPQAHPAYERAVATRQPPLLPYTTYFKRFKKTYPVLLQFESVLLKGRGIPPAGVPVEAMFLAELTHLLLGGGYDLDSTTGTLRVQVTTGTETFQTMSGEPQTVAPGDLCLRDDTGLLGNVIYGPEYRTRITETSRNVMFIVYAVPGVPPAAARAQLAALGSYLHTGLPDAELGPIQVWAADGTLLD